MLCQLCIQDSGSMQEDGYGSDLPRLLNLKSSMQVQHFQAGTPCPHDGLTLRPLISPLCPDQLAASSVLDFSVVLGPGSTDPRRLRSES